MRLTALLLTLLLLLPSGAVAAVSAAVIGAAQERMAMCCPDEQDSHHESGPQLSYSCCHASQPFQAGDEAPVRQASGTAWALVSMPAPVAAIVPHLLVPAPTVLSVACLAPRAPPWSVLIRFQRFLI